MSDAQSSQQRTFVRAGEIQHSLEAIEALALGRSARLSEGVHLEGSINGLVSALLGTYLSRRDRIDLHEGEGAWAPYVKQALDDFDESVRVYEAALYCSIVYLLASSELDAQEDGARTAAGNGGGAQGADAFLSRSKATFASLVKFFEPELWSVCDMDAPVLDNGEGAPGDPYGILESGYDVQPYPASVRMLHFYDKLTFSPLVGERLARRNLIDGAGRYDEMMEILASCFAENRSSSTIQAYSPTKLLSYIEGIGDAVTRMVDAYLNAQGLAPLCDDQEFAQVMAAIENAKRVAWLASRRAGRA